jgi:DNA-binding NtrC family response regulator
MRHRIFILDDESAVLEPLTQIVEELGHVAEPFTDPLKALARFAEGPPPQLLITDLKMPTLDGLQVLAKVREIAPETQVIVISGHGTIDEAVAAMKKGAYDFISKPFNASEIENVILRALEKAELIDENLRLREAVRLSRIPSFAEGKNPEFRELLESAAQAAASDVTVLVLGESGTGKEVLSRYIVAHSRRADKPFVAVNCAAIPENLIESELFGHKKGAFTGAHQDRKGRFQEADGGTIFLDEIGELPLAMQAKLLRVLQEGEINVVGGAAQKVDVRIVAATNKNLRKLVGEGSFREDLFYRLNVIPLVIPPLRRRMEDLPAYIAHFLARCGARNGRERLSLSDEALRLMERYPWPGNMRELENAIERAVVLSTGDTIFPKALPAELQGDVEAKASEVAFRRGMKLEDIELMVIQSVLRYNHGDRGKTAEELGIGVRTLYRKLNEIQARDVAGFEPSEPTL